MIRLLKFPWECLATSLLWVYFTLGFSLFWLPLFTVQAVFQRRTDRRSEAFQRLIHNFFRGFFLLVRMLCPRLRIRPDPALAKLEGCVLVANHRSYLDPILLTSLFARHRTIVRQKFFSVPLFGWILRTAGYLPSGQQLEALSQGLARLPEFISTGGVFFVFPEGRRRRDHDPRPAPFKKGAFSIAARAGLPLATLAVEGTERLFPPERFLFRAADRIEIRLRLVRAAETLDDQSPSAKELAAQAQKSIEDVCGS